MSGLAGKRIAVLATLVTSRNPDDLPALCREAIRLFAEAGGRRQAAQ